MGGRLGTTLSLLGGSSQTAPRKKLMLTRVCNGLSSRVGAGSMRIREFGPEIPDAAVQLG